MGVISAGRFTDSMSRLNLNLSILGETLDRNTEEVNHQSACPG